MGVVHHLASKSRIKIMPSGSLKTNSRDSFYASIFTALLYSAPQVPPGCLLPKKGIKNSNIFKRNQSQNKYVIRTFFPTCLINMCVYWCQ